MTCTRCGSNGKTMPIFNVRPGGHSFSAGTQPDFESLEPPKAERACGDCLTDLEIAIMLSPAVEFVLSTFLKTASPSFPDILVAMETARAFFTVRNNEPNGKNRNAAIRALGLGEDQ